MTGPSGIAGAAAAPLGGAKAKLPDAAPDDAAQSGADTSEFAAFSELFSFMEAEENPITAAAPGRDDGKRTEDDAKDSDKDKEADTASPVLLAEMTHYQWFGANLVQPQANADAPSTRSGDASDPASGQGASTAAKVALSQNLDLPEPVREFVAKSGEMRGLQNTAFAPASAGPKKSLADAPSSPRGNAGNTRIAPTPAPPAPLTPAATLSAALALAPASAFPEAPPAPTVSASPPAPNASQVAKAAEMLPESPPAPSLRAPAAEPRQPEPQGADSKASLLALETVLSRSGSATKDSTDRGEERQISAPQLKEVRVSVIQQETHFTPAALQQPVFQIANHIDREMRSEALQSLQPVSNDPRSDASPVRVLNIQLDPPQLGPLTIRISLKEGALNLQLETARHETAALIQTDKDTLSGLLRSAGYVVDGLNVQVAAPDRAPPAQLPAGGSAGGFNQAAGQQPGSRQSDGRPAGRAATYGGQADTSVGSSHETQSPGSAKPRGGSVYL